VVSLALRVRHGACSLCLRAGRSLYNLDIVTGEPVAIVPSTTHAGICAECIVELGLQLVHGGRLRRGPAQAAEA